MILVISVVTVRVEGSEEVLDITFFFSSVTKGFLALILLEEEIYPHVVSVRGGCLVIGRSLGVALGVLTPLKRLDTLCLGLHGLY